MITHVKQAVATSLLKSVSFEHSIVSFITSARGAHQVTRWILIMSCTENISKRLPQGLRMIFPKDCVRTLTRSSNTNLTFTM